MRNPAIASRLQVSLALAAFVLGASAPAQDSLQLVDGRFVTGPKMTRTPEGVTLHLAAGDIVVPSAMVKTSAVSKTEGIEEEVLSEGDRRRVDAGYVRFEDKWVRPADRDSLMEKRREEVQTRIAEALEHSKWMNRYQEDSRYFNFQYTIDPEILRYWSDLMDGYYATFTKYWGVRPPAGHKKLEVCFYHDPDYYARATGAFGTGGYFRFVPPIELRFYYDRLDPDWTLNVMFHETNHYLVWLIDPKYKYPTWINEGLAEYYGASVWDPESKKLEVGGLLEGRLANVQQDILEGDMVGLERLMRIPHAEFSGKYYGWAWTLMHFMMHTKYEKSFKRFFISLPKDTKMKRERLNFPDYVMTQHYPDEVIAKFQRDLRIRDMKAFEEEWHNYIKQMAPSSGRGFFSFGRTALFSDMPIKAKRLFETAIEKGYDAPMVHVYYARALAQVPTRTADERKKNLEEAVAQYELVLAKDPVNPLFRVAYAKALNSLARVERKPNPETDKQLALAKELGDAVDGGAESTEVFRATEGWKPYAGKDDDDKDDGKDG